MASPTKPVFETILLRPAEHIVHRAERVPMALIITAGCPALFPSVSSVMRIAPPWSCIKSRATEIRDFRPAPLSLFHERRLPEVPGAEYPSCTDGCQPEDSVS